jgi:uncharacterized membrane protein YGL010W
MKGIQEWLDDYGTSHQNKTNKAIHWICIPIIMFSLFGLLMAIPVPTAASVHPMANVATLVLVLALLFYLRLSFTLFLGFTVVGAAMIFGNHLILEAVGSHSMLALISVALFVVAWIGQFIGHNIEGAKPSFFKDLQFLLIGPAWLLHFIYIKLGIPYK